MRKPALTFYVFLLILLFLQPAHAQDFRLLSRDANTPGIDFSYARASYNETRGGFEVSRVIPLTQEADLIDKVKFFIGASQEGRNAESWAFTRQEYPVEWHVLVDVSKSMTDRFRKDPNAVAGGARAKKALEMVKDMLTSCPAQDRIIINFFSTDFVQVADIPAGASRNAANDVLTMEKAQEVGNRNYNGDNTTLYPLLARYADSKLADRQQETHRVVVLLTDGADESANQHEHWENVRRSFKEKGVRLNVFLIVPPAARTRGNHEANSPDIDESSLLTGNLAPETGGFSRIIKEKDLSNRESTGPMAKVEHAGCGSFFLPMKREALDALKIHFLHGNQLRAAVEWTKDAVLATAGPAPRSAKDIAAEETRRQAEAEYKKLPPLSAAVETALHTLSEQEATHAPRTTLQQSAENVQKAVAELIKGLEAVKAFPLQDFSVLKGSVEDAEVSAKLQELLRLHPLTEDAVLHFYGRRQPLFPSDTAPGTVVEQYFSPLYLLPAGLGIALAVLAGVLYAARIRRMKREQQSWQNKMDSLKAKVPAPHKPTYGSMVCLLSGQEWPVYKEAMTIGRAEDNDIILPDPGVSGHHCVLKKNRDGLWVLNDLNSNNGIFCQGRVYNTLNMLPEVSFILGRTELLFRQKE